jgi:5'-AMP-activated protein kinase regulatory beta subunit
LEDTEGIQGVTVPELPENRDMDVQEPVFGSPIDTPSYLCSMPGADIMKSGLERLNVLAGLQEETEAQQVSRQSIPIVFRWDSGGREVYICGSFNNWETKIPMTNSHSDFTAIVELPEGRHEYKFFVDGQWLHDPNEECSDNGLGSYNNVVTVTKRDFDVYFETRELTSPEKGGSSPQGSYSQEMPLRSAASGLPPHLPPLLQQTVLNQEPPSQEDPNLLAEPNHVILNHLYALSIKVLCDSCSIIELYFCPLKV